MVGGGTNGVIGFMFRSPIRGSQSSFVITAADAKAMTTRVARRLECHVATTAAMDKTAATCNTSTGICV